jgi:hypothetical protein
MLFFFKKKYWDKNIVDWLGLICQIYDPDHEIKIILKKAIKTQNET